MAAPLTSLPALIERRPASNLWVELEVPFKTPFNTTHVSMWKHPSGSRVISALEMAEYPDGSGEIGLQWHVSIARPAARASQRDVDRALLAFGMKGTEEDNHEPGNARHFWLPVDPTRRVECECKVTEVVNVDPDGHRWSNPIEGQTDPVHCRGCESAPITGRACPLHAAPLQQLKGGA